MTNWAKIGLWAGVSGSVASVVTSVALAALARTEGKGVLQPTHSTSHWLHGEGAGRRRAMDSAHTLTGYATHHASAILWALPFELWVQSRRKPGPGEMLAGAAATSAIAAFVDYGVAPKRFTPGWEAVLPMRSIVATYGALAIGLAAGGLMTQRMRSRGARTRDRDFAARAHPPARSDSATPRSHNHREREGADKLYALIDDIRVCMMTTKDSQARLFSRPMFALKPDNAGDLWFFTRISSHKMRDLGAEDHVNLAYSDPGKQHYVSVSGRAQIVRDRRLIEEKWSQPMRTWFPDGVDDPELSLVRVHPETGEYWDSPSSAVMHLYGFAKASLTGEPPRELGETAKVDLR